MGAHGFQDADSAPQGPVDSRPAWPRAVRPGDLAPMSDPSARPLSIAMIGLRGIPASYGGVERAVEELSAALVGRGHRVTVFARKAYSDQAITQHRGVDVVHLGQINTKHLEAISHTSVALGAALRSRRFDVIHLHATGPAMLSFVPRLFKVPTVATVQGLDWRREKWGPVASGVLRSAARASAVFPNRTIVVSRELQRHYRETFGADTAYIPNGVRLDLRSAGSPVDGLTPDGFVLFLGRLVPEKHVHTLISSYRHVDTDRPLVIAGPDSHSPGYVEELQRLAAGDPRVRLIGARYGDEKTWLLKNALTFVQPSSIEGLPIALLEALGSGRFPIVSDIPENLEPVTLQTSEALGLRVKVGSEEDLARAISEALRREDRALIGRTLQKHVLSVYEWERIAAETEDVYRDVIRRAPAAARR
jgi:glycosyltransferase involved in cell wall biosynthesis